jgi:4'-phosphopantetheinyl transferase
LCLLAVTEDVEVGVDVERVRPLDDALTIAKNRFTPAEAAAIDSPESFFALWTRKEAVSKCLGWGLSLPFDVFSVAAQPGSGPERIIVEHQGESSTQWIQEVPLDQPGFVAAMATEGEGPVALTSRFFGSTDSSTSGAPPTQKWV